MSVDPCAGVALPTPDQLERYSRKGFITIDELVPAATCRHLNERLEAVLRGTYDTGKAPDKVPKFSADKRVKPGKKVPPLGGPSKRTLQVINIWKADRAFAKVVLSPRLGQLVATLAGWPGARVANDQVWAKPAGASALTFHRDSAYFDFVPSDVATVWIAFDDMEPELGPLEYVEGSHAWGDGRIGSAIQFFDTRGPRDLLHAAARLEGIDDPVKELEVTMIRVRAGGLRHSQWATVARQWEKFE